MNKTLFIAEIGNNHNGDIKRAKRLILAAKEAGAQIAKFQIRDFNTLYRGGAGTVEDLGVEYTKDLLLKYELPKEDHVNLSAFCIDIGMEYMCTPWDHESINFLERLNVKRYKVSSADFDNIPLIESLIKTKKQLILSTGMASFEEIRERVQWLKKKRSDFIILHCNSTYPAPFEDIQLEFMNTLRELTSNVGYSGHERGISVSLAAIALGAKVIERHLTEDKLLEGPDHQASLLPEEFSNLIKMSAEIEKAMGEKNIKIRKISQGALLNKENLGKSIVAAYDILPGTIIKKEHLSIKSPGQGMPATKVKDIIGKQTKKHITKDDFIFTSHFEEISEIEKFSFKHDNWGIPVRPHDVITFALKFQAPVYEFHISYKDLERDLPEADWSLLSKCKILVHAPELFENSLLLNLCDEKNKSIHINNLNKVCEFSRKLSKKIGVDQNIQIIANIGGYSTHSFKSSNEKYYLYQLVAENLKSIEEDGCEIIIQNMAPFPWHFGGQRYQNIFAYADEIVDFCVSNNRRIALDTAHLSMHCKFRQENFIESVNKLKVVTAHWHMSDAEDINGEGVAMGNGDVNFNKIMGILDQDQSFIVETWQGHKNFGEGFYRDLKYLLNCQKTFLNNL